MKKTIVFLVCLLTISTSYSKANELSLKMLCFNSNTKQLVMIYDKSVPAIRSEKLAVKNDLLSGSKTLLFPNPVMNQAILKLNMPSSNTLSIKIVNIYGISNEIWNGRVQAGTNDVKLDLNGFIPGCYSLVIEGESYTESIKLIKQ